MKMLRASIALSAVAILAFAGSASAKTAFGVVPQDGALPSNDELKTMRHGGAESIRLMAHWPTMQPTKQGRYDWTTLDGLVREATREGVKPFPFFYGTPDWAVAKDGRRDCDPGACSVYPPSSHATRKAFAEFVEAAVKRYGPGGAFWRKPKSGGRAGFLGPIDPCSIDPTLPGCVPPPQTVCDLDPSLPGCAPPDGPGTTPPPPPPPTTLPGPGEAPCDCRKAHPIRVWQIWNEQNSSKYFAPKVDVKKYAKLLKAAGGAIHDQDRGAEVVLGGMWGPDSAKKVVEPISTYLKKLYRVPGARGSFDSIALHPYSANVSGAVAQLDTARRVADNAGDREAGIWVTEIGWASGGPADEPYVKGLDGQAKLLKGALGKMRSRARRYRLRGIFWYSWRDREGGEKICDWCGNAGLRELDGSAKPAWKAFSRLAKR